MMSGMLISLRKWFDGLGKKQKLFAALLVFSLVSSIALFGIGSASSVTEDPLDSTPFFFLSAFVKLAGVLLLIVGVSVIARRWVQPGMGAKSTRQMRLVETVRLSPRQALHLVTIGNQKLLIGATDQNVSLIAPIEEDSLAFPVDEKSQPGLEFGSLLRSFSFDPAAEKAGEKNEGSHV
jgi:flagellar biosynthetic protein FliO